MCLIVKSFTLAIFPNYWHLPRKTNMEFLAFQIHRIGITYQFSSFLWHTWWWWEEWNKKLDAAAGKDVDIVEEGKRAATISDRLDSLDTLHNGTFFFIYALHFHFKKRHASSLPFLGAAAASTSQFLLTAHQMCANMCFLF